MPCKRILTVMRQISDRLLPLSANPLLTNCLAAFKTRGTTVKNLNEIAEQIREEMNKQNDARDKAVIQSRELIRHCAECIRAIHRQEWESSREQLQVVKE